MTSTSAPNSHNETLKQIEQCLALIQSSQTSNEQRLELESQLGQFQRSRGSHLTACSILGSFLQDCSTLNCNNNSNNAALIASVITPHAIHYLCSVIEYWGGSLAKLESLGPSSVRDFLYTVQQLFLQSFTAGTRIKHVPNGTGAVEYRVKLNLIQTQIKVAYCRMGRCLHDNITKDDNFSADENGISTNFVQTLCNFVSAPDRHKDVHDVEFAAAHRRCGCAALATFCEELAREDLMLSSPLPARRTRQIRLALSDNLPTIMAAAAYVIVQHQSDNQSTNNDGDDIGIVRDCLRCVSAVLNMDKSTHLRGLDASSAISIDLMKALFAVIDAAAAADGHCDVGSEIMDAGSDALECLSDVIARACWPAGQAEQFIMEISSRALRTLSIECDAIDAMHRRGGEDEEIEPICVERFRSQASHFLEIFCHSQLARAIKLSQNGSCFDMASFLQLMARYTFALPSALEQTDALVSWISMAEFMTSSQNSNNNSSYITSHELGLSEVLVAVIDLNLFSTNGKKLAELDGEEIEFPDESASSGDTSTDLHFEVGNSRRASNHTLSDDASHYQLPTHIDGALRSLERGSLLADSCVLSAILCGVSSKCANASYDAILSRLSAFYNRLQELVEGNTSGNGNGQELDALCWDICSCYRFFDLGHVALSSLSFKSSSSSTVGNNNRHADDLARYWEVCKQTLSTCESLMSSRAWSKHSNLAYVLSVGCTCCATFLRGLTAVATNDRDGNDGSFQDHPARAYAVELLNFATAALNSFSSLPAPSFVVSSICSMMKDTADCLSQTLAHPRYILRTGDVTFLLECQNAALSMLKNQSCLSQCQLQFVHRASVKLVFSVGFSSFVTNNAKNSEEIRSIVNKQQEIFISGVLQPLLEDLGSKSRQVIITLQNDKGAALTSSSIMTKPPLVLQKCGVTIQRSCQALQAVCQEFNSIIDNTSKQLFANTMGPCMEILVPVTGVYAKWCMSGGGTVVSTAASLFSLQVTVISTLNKYVGKMYQMEALKTVISALTGISSTNANIEATMTHGRILALKALMELLLTIFNTRDRSILDLLHQACDLLRNTIAPICTHIANAPELLPYLIRMIRVIVLMQWRHLSCNSTVTPIDATDLKAMLSAQRCTRIKENFITEFDFFMSILLGALKTAEFPPSLIREAILVVEEFGEKVNLYKVLDFEARFKNEFFTTIMESLLKQSCPMNSDQMTKLLHHIAKTDLHHFFDSFLTSLILSMTISESNKNDLLKSWPHDIHSFESNCHDFLCECRYLMEIASLQ